MKSLDARLIGEMEGGLPPVRRPFAELARRLGVAEVEVLQRLAAMKADGRLRRLAAIVNQRQVGLLGNVLVAWNVPADRAEEVGRRLAAQSQVSHVYERPPRPGWPYRLYAMVHAASETECAGLIRGWAAELGAADYQMLPTVREWKKSPPVYSLERG